MRGSNGVRSHHGTADMFFLVNAKGKNEQATIHLADDSADTTFRMPAANQGGQRALRSACAAMRCDALQYAVNVMQCDMRGALLHMHLYASGCVTMHVGHVLL